MKEEKTVRAREYGDGEEREKREKDGGEEIFLSLLLTWCQPRPSGLEKHIRDLFAL